MPHTDIMYHVMATKRGREMTIGGFRSLSAAEALAAQHQDNYDAIRITQTSNRYE